MAYVVFVATIWLIERQPPALGETAEVAEAQAEVGRLGMNARRVGRELALVVAGVAATAAGAVALVEGVRRISDVESTQTRLGLVVVGFATAFELVVLAWSAARRGITAGVVAGVIRSFTYNVTMTLGVGALARPLRIADPDLLRRPMASDAAVVGDRGGGWVATADDWTPGRCVATRPVSGVRAWRAAAVNGRGRQHC